MDESFIKDRYLKKKQSMKEIALESACSVNKVSYWLKKYGVQKRDISEAMYVKHNPNGDPFSFSPPKNIKDAIVFGCGIGLYWGEGTKADKSSVRLGNSDPNLIRMFIRFLEVVFKIDKNNLKFSLQLFEDQNVKEVESKWRSIIGVSKSQFYKTTVTKTNKIGTYRNKNQFGVLTLYYHNKKLRDKLMELLPI